MNYRETMSRLNAALNNVDLAYATIAKKYGLTFNALMMVYLLEESGKCTQKQIGDSLHLPKSTVHSILLGFIKEEYITLQAGNNKKEKFVVITASGHQHFAEMLRETQEIEKRTLTALGDKTCILFTNTAETLGSLMMEAAIKASNEGV